LQGLPKAKAACSLSGPDAESRLLVGIRALGQDGKRSPLKLGRRI
jgi:hypothetical protein